MSGLEVVFLTLVVFQLVLGFFTWSSESIEVVMIKTVLAFAVSLILVVTGILPWWVTLINVIAFMCYLLTLVYWPNPESSSTAEYSTVIEDTPVSQVAPVVEKRKISRGKHCPFCRNKVKPDDVRCESCGGPLSDDD